MIGQQEYTMTQLDSGVWAIEMNMVRAFLVAGDTSAVLIDTGAGGVNLQAAVRGCTILPVRVVNTHSHFDHISGNGGFDMQFAHPLELGPMAKAGFQARPVGDGFGFDLGGRILQIVGLPGHSPGSIGVWDAQTGFLFAGDTVAKGRPVFLCLDGASQEAFLRSMDRILAMEQDEHGGMVRRIFCAHGELETDMDTVRKLKACVEGIMRGEIEKEPMPSGMPTFANENTGIYRYEDVSVLAS